MAFSLFEKIPEVVKHECRVYLPKLIVDTVELLVSAQSANINAHQQLLCLIGMKLTIYVLERRLFKHR